MIIAFGIGATVEGIENGNDIEYVQPEVRETVPVGVVPGVGVAEVLSMRCRQSTSTTYPSPSLTNRVMFAFHARSICCLT